MIHAENVWKRFRRCEALRGLTFTVPDGSAYALIGANGAGKTTATKIAMNMLEPTSGTMTTLGVDSRRISPTQLGRIGYVSESQEMPERLTVGEYLGYLRPFYTRWDDELETTLRKQLLLPPERRIRDLSHGMRMKMALACALPFRPELLILDEPFSGLDPLVRDEFMESLLRQAGEMTILISSHELSEIEGLVTHVAFLDEGKLLFEEPMSDLAARFREVRVVRASQADVPANLPADWLDARADGAVLRFVDSQFAEATLAGRVRAAMPDAERIDVETMGLRSIFTALARAMRGRTERTGN